MRAIRFRAWDKITKTMRRMEDALYRVEGSPFKTKEFGNLQAFFGDFKGDFILMQFTGLFDKEGKEIYEGDILEYETMENTLTRKAVRWSNEEAAFGLDFRPLMEGVGDFGIKVAEISRVVGNIHENPDLPEKGTV